MAESKNLISGLSSEPVVGGLAYIVSGNSTDYGWKMTSGHPAILWTNAEYQILQDCVAIRFQDISVSMDENGRVMTRYADGKEVVKVDELFASTEETQESKFAVAAAEAGATLIDVREFYKNPVGEKLFVSKAWAGHGEVEILEDGFLAYHSKDGSLDELTFILHDGHWNTEVLKIRIEDKQALVEVGSQLIPSQMDEIGTGVSLDIGAFLSDQLFDEGTLVQVTGLPPGLQYDTARMRIEGIISEDVITGQPYRVSVVIHTSDRQVMTSSFEWTVRDASAVAQTTPTTLVVPAQTATEEAAAASVLFSVAAQSALAARSFTLDKPGEHFSARKLADSPAFDLVRASSLLAGREGQSLTGKAADDLLDLRPGEARPTDDRTDDEDDFEQVLANISPAGFGGNSTGAEVPTASNNQLVDLEPEDIDTGSTSGGGTPDAAPFLGAIQTVSTLEDTTRNSIDVLSAAFDPEGEPLTLVSASATNGSVTINADDTITYIPDPEFNGGDIIEYSVSDPGGNIERSQVIVEVVPVNDAPVAGTLTPQTVAEDTAFALDVLSAASDIDGDALSVRNASALNGTVVIDGSGTITYSPNADYNGPDTITYTIDDGNGGTDTSTFSVDVTPVNDAPRTFDDSGVVDEDGSVSITILGNDVDLDGTLDPTSVQIAGTTNPGDSLVVAGQGVWSVDGSMGRIVFTPDADYTGPVTAISYTVADDSGAVSDPASVSVSINAINDAPSTTDNSATGTEDEVLIFNVLDNDADIDSPLDPTTVMIVGSSGPGQPLTIPGEGVWSIVGSEGQIAFTPEVNFNGAVTPISYTVQDLNGATSSPASVSGFLNPVNDTPEAGNPPVSMTDEDTTSADIDVLSFASDPDGDTVTLSSTVPPSALNGSVTTGPGGVLRYTPSLNFNGVDTITYTLSDGNGGEITNTLSIVVAPINDAPEAGNPPLATTDEDTVLASIDVLSVASDVDGDLLTVNSPSATNGTVTANPDGTLQYVPDPDTNGLDTITYTVDDGNGGTTTGITYVFVSPVNDAPVAAALSDSTSEDVPFAFDVVFNAVDVDGSVDPVTVAIVGASGPGTSHVVAGEGTWTVDAGTGVITFTPELNYNGPVTDISYTVRDNDGAVSTPATLSVTLTDANDAPTASDLSASLNEDSFATYDVSSSASDIDGTVDPTSVRIVGVSGPGTSHVVPGEGTWTVNATTGEITFTPESDYAGPVSDIQYTIADDNGDPSAPATLTATITEINDAPVASNLSNTTDEDAATTFDVVTAATGIDGTVDPTSVVIVGASGPGTSHVVPGEGTWTVNASTGAITFTPEPDYAGPVTDIAYTVSDDDGAVSPSATLSVTLTEVNDEPVGAGLNNTTTEDTATNFDVVASASDIDGTVDPTTVAIVGASGPVTSHVVPGEGTWTVNATSGVITFTPELDYTGPVTNIAYTVNDDDGATSSPAPLSVVISPANDAPVAVDDNGSGTEDTALVFDVLSNDNDLDGTLDPASVQIGGTAAAGDPLTVPGEGVWSVNSATGEITFTPDTDFNGVVSPVTYTVNDNLGAVSNAATISGTLAPVNEAPEPGAPASGSTAEDTNLNSFDVLSAASDVEGDTLTLSAASAANGTVTINPDYSLNYAPNADYYGTDTVTYTIDDGNGGQTTNTVSIVVSPVNDNPDAGSPPLASGTEDTTVNSIDVLSHATDIDGDVLSVTGPAAGNGTVTVNPDGSLRYVPDADFNGLDTITYTIDDGNGGTDAGSVLVFINSVNDAPVAVDDSATVNEDGSVIIDVLSNDGDVDGSLVASSVQIGGTANPVDSLIVPGEGTWSVNTGSGQIIFTPEPDYEGTVADITYTVEDNSGAVSAPASVSVTLTPVNDAPVANDDAGTTNEDTSITIDVLANDTDIDGSLVPASVQIGGTTNSGDPLVVAGEGTWSVNTTTGEISFTPEPDFDGPVTDITYTVEDDAGVVSNATTVSVTINSINDAPVALADNGTTNEDSTVVIDVLANDSDVDGTLVPGTVRIGGTANAGDPLTVPGEGVWTVNTATGAITFTPELNYAGTVTDITYTVEDDSGATSASTTVSVTITGVNDAPSAADDADIVDEDSSVTIDVLANDTDSDGTLVPSTVQIAGTAAAGDPLVVAGEGTWTVNTTTGAITFTPEPDYAGPVTDIQYTIDDDAGGTSNPATVSVTLTEVNDAPTVPNIGDNIDEDTVSTFDVVANATDIDGTIDPTSVVILGASGPGTSHVVPGEGTWTVNATTGVISFTPEPDYSGSITGISYTVADNDGAVSGSAFLLVTIREVNDIPVVTMQSRTIDEDTAAAFDVVATATDVDGTVDPATVQIVGASGPGTSHVVAGEGIWTVNATTGVIAFTPEPDYAGPVTDVQYTIDDDDGATSAPATLSVTLTEINDAPVAGSLGGFTDEDNAQIYGTLSVVNDVDGTLDPATVQIVGTAAAGDSLTEPGVGIWTVNSVNGDITFTPEANYEGPVAPINFTVMDNDGAVSNQGTITHTINPVNDSPTIAGASLPSTLEDDSNPPGETVSNLVGGSFNDPDAGASLSGIVVTSNNTPASSGAWQYSTDAGTSWFDVGTVGTNGLALSESSLVRFLPEPDFNGPTDLISFRALDDSYAGAFTNGSTRELVDTSSPGGSSPISSSLVSISTTVISINDAPVAGNDSATSNEDTARTYVVFSNDSDVDGTLDPATVQIVGTASAGDPFTEPGVGTWTVNAANGNITFTPVANYDGSVAPIQYIVRDDQGAASNPATITHTITPLNDAPTAITATNSDVDENSAGSTVVGTLNAVDPDTGDTFSFSLVSDPSGYFGVYDLGTHFEIQVAPGATLDHEAMGSHDIVVQVTDSGGLTHQETLTINVSDVNEAPFNLVYAGNEGTSINTDGGNAAYYQASDGGSLMGGLSQFTFETQFAVQDTTGQTDVPLASYHTGEAGDELELSIRGVDALPAYFILEINNQTLLSNWDASGMLDGNQHTVSVSWENGSGDWVIYADGIAVESGTGFQTGTTLSSGGSLVFGNEQDSNGGSFQQNHAFSGTFYDIRLFDDVRSPTEIAVHAGNTISPLAAGLIANWQFGEDGNAPIVDVVSGNDLVLNQSTGAGWTVSTPQGVIGVEENSAAGTLVATLTASDVDAGDTLTFSITSDPSGFFQVVGNELRVATGATIDYETGTNHTVTVQAQDSGGLTVTTDINVAILDVGENPPTDITAMGRNGVSINADGGNSTFYSAPNSSAIFGGLNQVSLEVQFSIADTTGLVDVPLLNYIDGTVDEVDIRIDDPNGTPRLRAIMDGNVRLGSWDASPLLDGSAHTVSFTWDSAGGTYSFYVDGTLVDSGTGLDSGGNLSAGGMMVLGQDQDSPLGTFENTQTFSGTLFDVRVFSDVRTSAEVLAGANMTLPSSEPGLVANWLFDNENPPVITDAVSGNDLNRGNITGTGWTANAPSAQVAVAQSVPVGTVVATLATTDADPGDTFTYTILNDAPDYFDIVGNQLVVSGGTPLNYVLAQSHSVDIQVQDAQGFTYVETFSIQVLNDNGVPPAANVLFRGTPNVDLLTGTADSEYFYAQSSDDTINGGDGADKLHGQDGNDTLNGGDGADRLYGDREFEAIDSISSISFLNTSASGDQSPPKVVALADGHMLVVWYDDAQSDQAGNVRAQFVEPDGTKIGPQLTIGTTPVDGGNNFDMPPLDAVRLENGTVMISWQSEQSFDRDGKDQAVVGVIVDTYNYSAGSEFLINTTGDDRQSAPSLTALDDGRVLVVWYDLADKENDNGSVLFGQFINPDGSDSGSEFNIGSTAVGGVNNDDMPPLITVRLMNGNVLVTWQSIDGANADGDNEAVVGAIVNSATGIVGSEFVINTTATGSQSPPHTIALANGGAFVTWYGESDKDGDSGMTVYGQYLNSDGSKNGTEITIGTAIVEGDNAFEMPPLTAVENADGDVLVSWVADDSLALDGSFGSLVKVLVDSGTQTAGAQSLLNTTTSPNPSAPVINLLHDGRMFATWYGNGDADNASNMIVLGQFLNADGSLDGPERLVSSFRVEGDDAIDMPPLTATMTMNGDIFVSWATNDSNNYDGDGSAVVSVLVSTATTTGDDVLNGGVGNDYLSGGDGNDTLDGGADNDTLDGGNGDDTLIGGAGADAMDGGAGIDTVDYSSATAGVDVLMSDTDAGGLLGAYASTTAGGQTGDAAGDTYANIENIVGTAFDDRIYGTGNVMTADLGAGSDIFDVGFTTAVQTINGGAGIDFIFTSAGDDTINGGEDNDSLSAAGGDDIVNGDAGDDYLYGRNGADRLNGGIGDDSLDGGIGADIIDGGAGTDTVGYSGATMGVDALFEATDADGVFGAYASTAAGGQAGEATGDSYTSIEGVVGTTFNDRFYGTSTGMSANLRGGDDMFDNALGSTGVDAISGGLGNDQISTGGGNDTLSGDDGDDVLTGGAGADTLNGGAGQDTASFANATSGVVALFEASDGFGINGSYTSTAAGGVVGDAAGDLYFGIEGIVGSDHDDQFYGTATGMTVNMGSGNDTFDNDQNGTGVDIVSGGQGADFIDTGDGDDTLEGGGGADSLNGGLGYDTVTFANATAGVDALFENTDTNGLWGAYVSTLAGGQTGEAAGDSYTLVEAVIGSAFDDRFYGVASGMNVSFGDGNDSYDNDDISTGIDVVDGDAGDDTIATGGGDDILNGGAGNDTLVGEAGADAINGGTGNDTLVGGDDDDTLTGGANDDYIDGGTGSDTAIYSGNAADYTVTANPDDTFTIVDNRAGSPDGTDTLVGVDYLQFADQTLQPFNPISGTGGFDVLVGTNNADNIDAGAGDDAMNGLGGDDTLVGGNGLDILIGGADNDTLTGGNGVDLAVYSGLRSEFDVHDNQDGTYVVTDLRTNSPDGTDFLDSIETLQFSDQTVAIGTAVTAVSPIVFDLSGDGEINVTGETTAQDKSGVSEVGSTVDFDMDGDGDLEAIEWLDGTGDGLLVDNRDGMAADDMNGTRLFGDQDGAFEHGYQQLSELDTNADNVISGDEMNGLELWVDDGDAKVDEGEMFTLVEMGISEINLDLDENATDEEGRNLFQSSATRADGSSIMTEDVWFAEVQDPKDEEFMRPQPIVQQPLEELMG